MTRFMAAFRREFRVYVHSVHGWVAALCMLFIPAINQFRFGLFVEAEVLDLSRLYGSWLAVLSLVVPALTMRVCSEEKKTGIDLLLRTLPVSSSFIILVKALAVYAFVSVFILIDTLIPLSLSLMGDVPFGLTVSQTLGLFTVSAVLVSLGVFVSSLTRSQLVALLGSLFLFALLSYADSLVQMAGLPSELIRVSRQFSLEYRFTPFIQGMIDGNALFYFAGLSAVLLRMAVHAYESRRY
ncbi:MAG: ABC transporter permease [Spirochaetota bacterium]